jgi:L,D-transpeptidase-like protein
MWAWDRRRLWSATAIVAALAATSVFGPATAAGRERVHDAGCRSGSATATVPGWPTARAAWRAQPWQRSTPRRAPGGHAGGAPTLGAGAPWLLVLGSARDRRGGCWIRVRLPGRPNDADGWLPRAAVTLQPTPWRIAVSRAARTLSLYRAGRLVSIAQVVIGKSSTRTPGGLFAVAGAWRNPPTQFSGSWILTLTAHSRVLRRFDGGEGRVAIHGRGGASLVDPLGSARSHGCVRLANRDIAGLVRTVGSERLAGTPVRIR